MGINTAIDRIASSRNEQERIGIVKEEFEDAERLLDDGADKEEAVEKAQLCDELANSLMDTLNKRLQDALDMAGENDEETEQDLLQIYHAFSMQVECMVDDQEVHDAGIPREKGQARNRLDTLMAELSKFKAEKDSLRKLLHKMVDDKCDEQGWK